MANPSHHIPAGAGAPEAPPRFTLRHLPLPAKLVLSTFLLAVGVGYTSAMVQLHMHHGDRDGTTLPTKENVIAVFAGKVWKTKDNAAEPAPCRLELVVMGNKDGGFNSNNMAPAFFKHDGANYHKQAADPARKPKLDAEREGERRALVAWAHAAPNTREQAYRDNRFTLPKELAKLAVTPNYVDKAAPGTTVLVQHLVRDRCVRCHKADGEMSEVPLGTYEALLAYLPVVEDIPEGGGYVDSGRLMSLEKLTQSTHAHLLSFAVLFTCTGLIFAFTGWPGLVRGVVGPLVLVAQVADISCWWLARLDPYGPVFAQAIIFTGGVVGVGLAAHIVGGLFGMYGAKGKAVLLLMFAVAAGGGGAVYKRHVEPYLAAEKAKAQQKADDDKKRRDDEKARAAKADEPKPGPEIKAPVPPAGPSELERLLTGSWKSSVWVTEKGGKVGGRPADGAMVRAFFDKEDEFKRTQKDDGPAEAEKLVPQREGERDGLLAWTKAAPDVRQKAYADNKFALPEALVGKATPEFTEADGKFLKVQALIEARCLRCHDEGNKNGSLATYEHLSRYFVPRAKE